MLVLVKKFGLVALGVFVLSGFSMFVSHQASYQPAELSAATALGDTQGVPNKYTGNTYPAETLCWVNISYQQYGPNWTPLCSSTANTNFFLIVGSGPSTYYSGSFTSTTYRAEIIWGNPKFDTFAVGVFSADLGGGQGQTVYATRTYTPFGYFYNKPFTGAGWYDLYKGSLDSAPTIKTVGDDVQVAPGKKVTLEWSCLPSREVRWEQKGGQGTFSQGGWGGNTIYSYPFASSVVGSGPGTDFDFTSTALKSSAVITAPATGGTYNYTVTCKGTRSTSITIPIEVIAVSITATDPTATEASQTVGKYTLSRTGPTTAALNVPLTLSGTARYGTPNQDYTLSGGGVTTSDHTATIPAGSASTVITLTPVNDTIDEPNETAILTVSPSSAYALGSPSAATVTIADNDLPKVSVIATDPNASETGPATGSYTITRAGVTTAALNVTISLSNNSAVRTSDYTLSANGLSNPSGVTVTIPIGSLSTAVTLTPVNDSLVEGTETATLTISPSSAYAVDSTKSSAAVSIADNDVAGAPSATISAGAGNGTARTVLVGSTVSIAAVYTHGAGDTLKATAINDDSTGNSVLCANIVPFNSSCWMQPDATKTYTYTAVAGTKTFSAQIKATTFRPQGCSDPTNCYDSYGTVAVTGVNPANISITANNTQPAITITKNTAATIRWNTTSPTNVTAGSCVVTNNANSTVWRVDTNAAGSSTGNLNSTRVYTLTCQDLLGTTRTDTVTVNIGACADPNADDTSWPACNSCISPYVYDASSHSCVVATLGSGLSATPSRVRAGDSVTLSWDTQGMSSCTLAKNGVVFTNNAPLSSGSFTSPAVNVSSSFTLTCTGLDNSSYSDTTSVTLVPTYQEI